MTVEPVDNVEWLAGGHDAINFERGATRAGEDYRQHGVGARMDPAWPPSFTDGWRKARQTIMERANARDSKAGVA